MYVKLLTRLFFVCDNLLASTEYIQLLLNEEKKIFPYRVCSTRLNKVGVPV